LLNNFFLDAVDYDDIEMIKVFLNNKKMKSIDSSDAAEIIERATRRGNYQIVQLLIKDPMFDPSERFNSAFKIALERKHVDIIKLLITDERVWGKLRGIEKEKVAKLIRENSEKRTSDD